MGHAEGAITLSLAISVWHDGLFTWFVFGFWTQCSVSGPVIGQYVRFLDSAGLRGVWGVCLMHYRCARVRGLGFAVWHGVRKRLSG